MSVCPRDGKGIGGQGVGLQGPRGQGVGLQGPRGSKCGPTGTQGVNGWAYRVPGGQGAKSST